MKQNWYKFLPLLSIIIFIACICAAIQRDIKNLRDGYSCDLRKRIVGARYQAEGKSPYFFKWEAGQDERLCDPFETGPSLKQNVTTLPPGYLWILQPLSKLNFPDIELTWFIVQYAGFLLIFILFFINARSLLTRIILPLVFSLFIFSKGWIFNIDIGQSYIIFPLLWSVGYFAGKEESKKLLFTGIILALCCWLRPVCILMALPFLLSADRRSFLKGFVLTGAICFLQMIACGQYNNFKEFVEASYLWTDYYNNLTHALPGDFKTGPWPASIEGQSDYSITALPEYTANLPIVTRALFNSRIPSSIFLLLLVVFIVASLSFIRIKTKRPDLKTLWLAGFIIYYAGELLVSIPKPSYYFVELIFPVCLLFYNLNAKQKLPLVFVSLGLFLACLFLKLVPMQLLLAEYIIIAGIIATLLYLIKLKPAQSIR